jgi:uncharacterized SAM-binding protein YcdF (DUF218 family)
VAKKKRIPTAVWVAFGLALAIIAGTTLRWTGAPSGVAFDEIGEADAIVVFVGGQGERMQTVVDLVNQGVADAVVIPVDGEGPEWLRDADICGGTGVRVFCPTTASSDTKGEARTIAEFVDGKGWNHVVVVTSKYHVERAVLRLGRCFDGRISAVAAEPDLGVVGWLKKASHEWLGTIEAQTIDRSC